MKEVVIRARVVGDVGLERPSHHHGGRIHRADADAIPGHRHFD